MSDLFIINTSDPTPLYAQLERAIRFAIAIGKLREGDRLPTVRQLAVELCINANTVARVYSELERKGVVETRRGVGTFVCENDGEPVLLKDRERQFDQTINRFLAEAGSLGYSLVEVVEHLESRLKKEKESYG
jgi:GntR family transcriptional regulator